MFGFGSRKTRGELVKAELGESLDHLMQATTHAASGVGATVGPRVDAAREAVSPTAAKVRNSAANGWASMMSALAPLAIAAVDGARQAGTVARKARSHDMKAMRKKDSRRSGRRWPRLAGLLAAGAAVGAASAIAMRRRRQQEWDEYDPGRALDAVREDANSMMGSTLADPMGTTSGSTAAGADRMASSPPPGSGEKLSSSTSSITDSAKQAAAKTTDKADGVLSNATAQSRNSRS